MTRFLQKLQTTTTRNLKMRSTNHPILPLPKYRISGNILQQYCGNITAILRNSFWHTAAILDFVCKLVSRSIARNNPFWQYCRNLRQYCGSIAAILQQYCQNKVQGPVVQSVVSLTSSLRVISLSVLADSLYNILIFFAEKM